MANIRLEDVSKFYGRQQVLADVSLEIDDGEMFALLGPSGSGKTTLLRLIAGLEAPSAGKVIFNNADFTHVSAQRRKAIIVFQDYALFPHLTVFQNIAFGLRAGGVPRVALESKVHDILDLVQLKDRQHSLPRELSGGQKQRVALARACVLEPRVLLLDEPFSNLDTGLRQSMRDFVAALQERLRFTCILVTHDKEEAFMMSRRVAVIVDSRLQQVDAPEVIFTRPLTKKLSDFLGEANYLDGRVQGGNFYCALGIFAVNAPDSANAVGRFRWDQLALTREAGPHLGRVTGKSYAGKATYYTVTIERGHTLNVFSARHDFFVGEEVFLEVLPSVVNVY
ncbi:MAG: Spermidine/putrescine import ATP-binding protein PotA [Firmicutes bacterium]|nr:Spermidine/putrescine import ATP-binding protein PotA [Bacillota bacterium]